MTPDAPACEREPVILRRANLDLRARLICAAAFRADGIGLTYREVVELADFAPGASGAAFQRVAAMERHGWLTTVPGISRSIQRGPRLVGLDHGWPLELVPVEEPAPRRATRAPKYERRAVLFETAGKAGR